MRLVSWNVNGLRAGAGSAGLRHLLESLGADIICLQETKITRNLLEESLAIVEGYNSYFSFSRTRSGYSGVATFCKVGATPEAAEEGLTGLFTKHDGAVGCYGDTGDFTPEELQSLESEGRAVVTRHRICTSKQQETTLTVINVYCPRADPDKPERGDFKLQFYRLLQARAEALLRSGGHVVIMGDINTAHKPIDHCDPGDLAIRTKNLIFKKAALDIKVALKSVWKLQLVQNVVAKLLVGVTQEKPIAPILQQLHWLPIDFQESFWEHPGRRWLNSFLWEPDKDSQDGNCFVDTFRFLHPGQEDAYTCWCSVTGSRHLNYGTRIDYILADRALAVSELEGAQIMSEVLGSDHCPVQATLKGVFLGAARCPPLCTRFLPEFAGTQQKLSRFLVKVEQASLPEKGQKGGEAELNTVGGSSKKRRIGPLPKGQGDLRSFFKTSNGRAEATDNARCPSAVSARQNTAEDSGGKLPIETAERTADECGVVGVAKEVAESLRKEPSMGLANGNCGNDSGPSRPNQSAALWKTLLSGPAPPPQCKAHGEPCVLRTVKKQGPNCGRRFYVCARPLGKPSDPRARCDFFLWARKGNS